MDLAEQTQWTEKPAKSSDFTREGSNEARNEPAGAGSCHWATPVPVPQLGLGGPDGPLTAGVRGHGRGQLRRLSQKTQGSRPKASSSKWNQSDAPPPRLSCKVSAVMTVTAGPQPLTTQDEGTLTGRISHMQTVTPTWLMRAPTSAPAPGK